MNFNNLRGGTYTPGKTSKVVTFKAGGVIVAGQTVSLDTAQTGETRAITVVQGGADALFAGIALEAAAAAGVDIRVCVGGYVEGVKTDGNVTSGLALMPGASGALIPYANSAVLPIVGVALETDDGTPVCDIFLHDLFPYKT